MKYIPADELIAEIEREIESSSKGIKPGKSDERTTFCRGEISTLYTIKRLIASLQREQREVDLEKEMKEYLGENWKDGTPIEVQDDMIKFARHFYELGFNARKEE